MISHLSSTHVDNWLQPNITFAMIKCDALRNGVGKHVINAIRQAGFRIIHSADYRVVHLEPWRIAAFYSEHVEKPYYPDLENSVAYGTIPLILELPMINSGFEDQFIAFKYFREIIGATNSRNAAENTIRGRFGGHKFDQNAPMAENAIHGSDSLASVRREIGIVFPDLETIRSIQFGDFWLSDFQAE